MIIFTDIKSLITLDSLQLLNKFKENQYLIYITSKCFSSYKYPENLRLRTLWDDKKLSIYDCSTHEAFSEYVEICSYNYPELNIEEISSMFLASQNNGIIISSCRVLKSACCNENIDCYETKEFIDPLVFINDKMKLFFNHLKIA